MYLTRRNLYIIILVLVAIIVLLAIPGCGVARDLPRYW
jgi:hypothetical protein